MSEFNLERLGGNRGIARWKIVRINVAISGKVRYDGKGSDSVDNE